MTDLTTALLASLDDQALEALAARLAPFLPASEASQPWLDVADAAEYLRCPRSRLYALVSAQRIPHRKDGSRLLFYRAELDQWVRSGGGRRP